VPVAPRRHPRSGATKAQVCDLRLWWALQVSNLRPLPCEPEKAHPSASPNSRLGWSAYARWSPLDTDSHRAPRRFWDFSGTVPRSGAVETSSRTRIRAERDPPRAPLSSGNVIIGLS
jgi:hypothetical protein